MFYLSKIKIKRKGKGYFLKAISVFLVSAFLSQELAIANPDLLKITVQGGAQAKASKAWAQQLLPAIPESVATIEDAYKFPGSNKTLILIQDAHTNNSGQFNVAKALDLIFKKEPIKYIFLEAGSGNESLSFLRKYASEITRKQVANSFLINGKLQGTEYLDLTSNHHFILWGVEDLSLYAKSVATYHAVAKEREKFEQYLSQIDTTIKTLKPKIYNPFLFTFDEKYQKYQKEEISLTAYYEALTAEAKKLGISFSNYPHLQTLNKLKAMESKINFKKASEEEQLAVLSLSNEDQKELLLASKENQSLLKLSANDNQVQKAFFALLEEKIATRINQYPELFKYFLYVKEARKIQAKAILGEQKTLEKEVFVALIRTEDEINLIKASKNLESLKKLFNLTLTPDEFDAYQKDKQNFAIAHLTGFLNKKIMDLKGHYDRAVFLKPGYEDIIQKCEEFYSLTYQRDQKFIENLTQKMNVENQMKAVLITGGYHTPNLKYLLKNQSVSYISLTPQVLQETNQKRYEELLLNQNVDTVQSAKVASSTLSNFMATTHTNMLMRILQIGKFGIPYDQTLAEGLADSPEKAKLIIKLMKEREKNLGGPLSGVGGAGFMGGRPIELTTPQLATVGARMATKEKKPFFEIEGSMMADVRNLYGRLSASEEGLDLDEFMRELDEIDMTYTPRVIPNQMGSIQIALDRVKTNVRRGLNPDGYGRALFGSGARMASAEYLTMSKEFERIIKDSKPIERNFHIFTEVREIARREPLGALDENKADEAILQIKEELIPHLLTENSAENTIRERLTQALLIQASFYFDTVKGFGPVSIDSKMETQENLTVKEDQQEDIFFASMQAIDAFQTVGLADTNLVDRIIKIAQKGLVAHRDSIGLQAMIDRLEQLRKSEPQQAEKQSLETSRYYEAVRRWTSMEAMLLKVISNVGLQLKEADKNEQSYKAANALLIEVLLSYEATGEGFYWLRQQAAYRLRDFDTLSTISALTTVTAPNGKERRVGPDSVYITMNLEAANKDAVSLDLSAGMSLVYVYRYRASMQIKDDVHSFIDDSGFEDKIFRVARLLGILDALVNPEVSESNLIDILRRLSEVKDHEFALAANILLDALEDIIAGHSGEIFSEMNTNLLKATVQHEARRAYLRIATAVDIELKNSENAPLSDEFNEELTLSNATPDVSFQSLAEKTHIVLGNLHNLSKLQSFEDGRKYMSLDRKIIIESGGGASIAMAGAVDRMTTDPALAVISGTDNGGSTLITRGFNSARRHILSGAAGDIMRFDIEAAVIERVPSSQVVKNLLNHRFGKQAKPFKEELELLYQNYKQKAIQERTADVFETVFKNLKTYAAEIDKMGLPSDYNAVKGLIYEGIQEHTRGHSDEFMNPDGIYAGMIEYKNLTGAKGFAVLDSPFGNEMAVKGRDGQEYIGQSYYSHTPKGTQRGREREAYRMADIDNYYPEVPIHSRVVPVVEKAKLILSGLCSWATSLGILLKNRGLVNAMVNNRKANKVLLTDPVKDDETRGMSWWESTVNFVESMAGAPLEQVWNKVLANSNAGIGDRPLFPARPQFGTEGDAYAGKFGGYAGANTPREEDVQGLGDRGIAVRADDQMMRVALTPQRQNPDLFNSTIMAVPELLASALWKLLDDPVKIALESPLVFQLIIRHEEIEALLSKSGLSWESFGMESVHELIFRPDLVRELNSWLNENQIPTWLKEKRSDETWFQYTIRTAIKNVTGYDIPGQPISLNNVINLGIQINGKNVEVQFLSADQTDKAFISNRVSVKDDANKLEQEENDRLGVIKEKDSSIRIVLPYEVLSAGLMPQERVKQVETVLKFQLEKARLLANDALKDETSIQAQVLQSLSGSLEPSKKEFLERLGQLSISVPLMRSFRQTASNNREPVVMNDMDSTVTAAGTAKDAWMAYLGWIYLKRTRGQKEIVTGQAFEGPWKQMVEPYLQVERMLKWVSTRTGVPRPGANRDTVAEDEVFGRLFIGAVSGNAFFVYRYGTGYEKVFQNSMDPSTIDLIKLAAYMTMPEVGYEVEGHVIEFREPELDPDTNTNKIRYAAFAVLPSGRFDGRRSFDPPPQAIKRRIQGIEMALILDDPAPVLKQLEKFVDGSQQPTAPAPWPVTVKGTGKDVVIHIPIAQQENVKQLYSKIKEHADDIKPVHIATQPGGATTLDISSKPKANGVAVGREQIAKASGILAERLDIFYVGDELSEVKIQTTDRGEIAGVGNDYSVAQKQPKGVKLLVHTGPLGYGVSTLPNTTKSYNPKGVVPVDLNGIFAFMDFLIRKGQAYEIVGKHSTEVVQQLTKKNFSIASFGVTDIHDLNESQAKEILSTIGWSGARLAEQKIVSMDVQDIPSQDVIGEKPYKLFKMAKAGFNVPHFFVVSTNGTGELVINDELREAFDRLKRPVIARSAHKEEGKAHSFSGVFASFKNISKLDEPKEDLSAFSPEDRERREWELEEEGPTNLRAAYELMVDLARNSFSISKYLEQNKITGFNPNDMNLIVMEELSVDVFGMFVTSDQNNPDKVEIHYEIRGKGEDRLNEKGGVVTYNKKTHTLGRNYLDEGTQRILIQFGETAEKIEKMFGIQQIELASSGGNVYVLQSRTINLKNSADVPRFSHYETLSDDLTAIGYGYYTLPIIVVDDIENTDHHYSDSPEYKDLERIFTEISWERSEEKSAAQKALNEFINKRKQAYKDELLALQKQYGDYILVIKDAEDVIRETESFGKNYEFLNSLVRQAKVVIRGRNQNAIRREDWDHVEKGGITIITSESAYYMMDGFGHKNKGHGRQHILTGDYLSILSNVDGAFVWKPHGARMANVDFLAPIRSVREALKDRDIRGWTINYRAVLNVKSKQGQIEDDTRLRDVLDDLRFLVIEKGANVNLIGHLGRREEIGGAIKDDRESLKLVSDRLQELLGADIPVKFNPQSVVESGLNISWADIENNQRQFGRPMVNVIENMRFANAEQAKIGSRERVDFGRGLSSLSGQTTKKIFVFGAFADLNSKGASVEDLPSYADEVYSGTAMVKETAEVSRVINEGIDAIVFSGSKPDKIAFLKNVLKALRPGGFVLLGSAASYALQNELVDLRTELEAAYPGKLIMAVDYVFAEDSASGKQIAVDIGSTTKELYRAKLDTLKTGQRLLSNGTQGWMERGYTAGNDAVLTKEKELLERGVEVVTVGGDGNNYARKAGLQQFLNATFFSGAQVPFAMLAGEKLVGLEALKAKAAAQGARLTIQASSSAVLEGLVNSTDAVTFIVRVHSETKQTGKLMLGSLLLDYKENPDGSLTIQGIDEKERTVNPGKWTKTTLEDKSAFQITFSMSDLKQALEAANSTVEEASISKALNGIKAVGVINLEGLNPNVKGFDEVVIPLLIEELKLAHKRPWGQNAKFLLKGNEALIQRISSQIPTGQDFIVTKEEDLGNEYTGASHILITTPGKSEKGLRHFFIQSIQEGDIPNFRGALRSALSLARIDKLETTNKDFSDIVGFVGRLLGHDIADLSEYIQVTENPALVTIEKIRNLYSLPAITRLPLNQIVQGARLAIRMIQQAA